MTSIYLEVMELIHRDEDGQGLAEYALILALIAIIAIVALIFLGGQVSKILSTVGSLGLTELRSSNLKTAGALTRRRRSTICGACGRCRTVVLLTLSGTPIPWTHLNGKEVN